MKKLLFGAVVIGVVACSPAAKENAPYAVAVALTQADAVALRYVTMPLCGPTHPKPACSEAAVSAQIKEKAQAAHDAVRAAEANPSLIGAAQAAVDALIQLTPKAGV